MIDGQVPAPWTAGEYRDRILLPTGRVVTAMERRGVPIDTERLRALRADEEAAVRCRNRELADWCPRPDMNWGSWQQLASWLHDPPPVGLGLEPSPYCKKGEVPDGKLSTDDRALEWIGGHNPDHREAITALRDARARARVARYARDWMAAGIRHLDGTTRLHAQFGMASDSDSRPGAKTGRFGVKNPALNQVKRGPGLREAFVAPPGKRLVVVDYSQLEVVIVTHLIATIFGEDDPLVRMVRAGEDIHGTGARFIFGHPELGNDPEVWAAAIPDFKKGRLKDLRQITKTGIYGRNYRKGIHGFATTFFLPNGEPLGTERATLLVNGLDRLFPGIPGYHDYVREVITEHRWITSLFGRGYPLPGAASKRTGEFNRAWRVACNWCMQAGGQEIMALAIQALEADERLKAMGYELAMVVHDETVGWCDEDRADECVPVVEEVMTSVVRLLAPLRAEGHAGRTWAEAK